MQARHLLPGLRVHVTDGPFAGFTASVVDPKVQPDGTPNQRKVLVSIDGAGVNGEPFETYILPRQVDIAPAVTAAPVQHDEAALTIINRGEVQQGKPITDPMDPALDEFRPDPSVVKKYISRQVPGGLTDVDYLLHLRDMRDSSGYSPNIALVGETQSGKTMLVQVLAVLAAERDGLPKPYPVFTLNGSVGISSYDLFGQPGAVVIDGKETIVWMDGLVPLALNCGGFLYLDEWNAVAPQQATALHPVLDDRRSFTNYQRAVPNGHGGYRPEVVKAHQNLWVLSTINPGYKGTQTMAEASTNRFRWMEWDYDNSIEETLIPSPTVRAFAGALREARAQRAITVPVGTSALRRFNEDLAAFGVDNALWVFTSMFPPSERERVRTICEDRGFLDLLKAEYPTPVFGPTVAQQSSPVLDPY
jgi:MoxR-like ATPase